jgi:hypothetical protein
VNMAGVVLGAIAAAAVFPVLLWWFGGTFNGCCPAPRCHHQPWMCEHKHLWCWTGRRWRTCGRRSYARKCMPWLISEITEELAKR